MKKILISPSILSADFAFIGDSAKMLEQSGADLIHCDVMDGVFVPNLTFGMKMVKDIKKIVNIPLDVHLMIVNPEKYVEEFINAGADILTIHYEACQEIEKTLTLIKSLGIKAGLSIKPNTSVKEIEPYLHLCDLLLVMSVEPGFGGQKFKPNALNKISNIRELSEKILIEVDGGITFENNQDVINAGVDIIVAGSTIFNASDKKIAIEKLRK